jgi:hypothetical protein
VSEEVKQGDVSRYVKLADGRVVDDPKLLKAIDELIEFAQHITATFKNAVISIPIEGHARPAQPQLADESEGSDAPP